MSVAQPRRRPWSPRDPCVCPKRSREELFSSEEIWLSSLSSLRYDVDESGFRRVQETRGMEKELMEVDWDSPSQLLNLCCVG